MDIGLAAEHNGRASLDSASDLGLWPAVCRAHALSIHAHTRVQHENWLHLNLWPGTQIRPVFLENRSQPFVGAARRVLKRTPQTRFAGEREPSAALTERQTSQRTHHSQQQQQQQQQQHPSHRPQHSQQRTRDAHQRGHSDQAERANCPSASSLAQHTAASSHSPPP
eukprot:6205744-Pleurochrysis_carterae.AAC.1